MTLCVYLMEARLGDGGEREELWMCDSGASLLCVCMSSNRGTCSNLLDDFFVWTLDLDLTPSYKNPLPLNFSLFHVQIMCVFKLVNVQYVSLCTVQDRLANKYFIFYYLHAFHSLHLQPSLCQYSIYW
jgi:hypothetical protein